jgi:hypothetical protein
LIPILYAKIPKTRASITVIHPTGLLSLSTRFSQLDLMVDVGPVSEGLAATGFIDRGPGIGGEPLADGGVVDTVGDATVALDTVDGQPVTC